MTEPTEWDTGLPPIFPDESGPKNVASQLPLPETDQTGNQPGFFRRLGSVAGTGWNETWDGPNRSRRLTTGVGVVALQVLDRARASIVFVPPIAVHVFESTHSPTAAGLAAGAVFGGWCAAVGGATTEGLHQFPQTVTEFEKDFPGVVGLFADSLPGYKPPDAEARQTSLTRRILGRISTGVTRGFTVSGIGSVAYVSTAASQGRSRGETHRLNLAASFDGGAAVGAVVFGLGETISQIAHDHPLLAERIQNDASNKIVWYVAAGVMIVGQYAASNLKKYWKSHHPSDTTQPPLA